MKTIRQVESSHISLLDMSALSIPPSSLCPHPDRVCCMVVFTLSPSVAVILISVHVIPIVPWNLALALV